MRMKLAVATLSLLALPVVAAAQVVTEMTPEQIKAAIISPGATGCYELHKQTLFGRVVVGCFTTPFSRVVAAAQAAKKKCKPFTEADVTPELIAAGELHVHGMAGNTMSHHVASVEAVVIMPAGSKDRAKAILPTKTIETTDEFKNAMGANFEGKSITAIFPLDVLSEQNAVHIVYDQPKAALGTGNASCEDCEIKCKLDKVR